ncbi:MAG TPA: PQQ-dependent sugar dehydrogenase [Pedobacter sp.]|uniref:PQQ-dependent sugar dehydrogenase n=1 Tax=Pedobacter sp. TaxID=1411316 RepID=UPI002C1CDB12|nr:PQQ-dependent sugar dehydrogenase [Pedobacter sp.]HMI03193.1 PQQ-dependent sugar dehydrogenase [Pedobacter sp.]
MSSSKPQQTLPLIWTACLLFCSTLSYAQQGGQIYKKYCAGCHGSSQEGNSATPLIKKNWVHGSSSSDIFKTIKEGVPKTEMIGWGKILKNDEIKAVTDFIVSAQTKKPDAKKVLPATITTKDYTLNVEKLVTEDLQTPWGIEFVNKNTALITEKSGKLRWLVNGKLDPEPIKGLPQPYLLSSTAGLMDIALDPKYASNGWVYLAYSHTNGDNQDKSAKGMTRIVRGKIKGHNWTAQQTLFEVADSLKVSGGDRWGCRFLFDKQGLLYFSIGDMGRAMASQDLHLPTGKIFRVNTDGSVPKTNPFLNDPKALPAIFSIGNRNVEGITQHPVTGKIWTSEHGPRGGDELNILKKGANYGWPVITYGIDYSGAIISDKTHQEGMEQPVTQWTPSIAVCPIEFCTSPLFPKWRNNLFVGALAYEELQRLVIDKDKIVSREMIFKGYGRVRDIKAGPDGAVYVLLNKPDMVIRITPKR